MEIGNSEIWDSLIKILEFWLGIWEVEKQKFCNYEIVLTAGCNGQQVHVMEIA